MDLQDTYWRIVEMLEDNSDPWVQDTLKWWNRHCKSSGSGSSTSKRTINDGATSSSEDNMAQVRARRSAAAPTATRNNTPTGGPGAADDYDSEAPVSCAKPARRTEPSRARKTSTFFGSGEDPLSEPEAPSRNESTRVSHANLVRQTEPNRARRKTTSTFFGSDEDLLSEPEAPSRNESTRVESHASKLARRTEPSGARKTTSTYFGSDRDGNLSEAPSTRNKPSHLSHAKPRRTEPNGGARKTTSTRVDLDDNLSPEAPSTTRNRLSHAKPRQTERSETARKTTSMRVDSDEDLADSEAPSRLHLSLAKPRQTEPNGGARKTTSTRVDSDEDLLEAPSSRNCPSHAKPRQTETGGARKTTPTRVDLDDDSPSSKAPSRNHLSHAKPRQTEPNGGTRKTTSTRVNSDEDPPCAKALSRNDLPPTTTLPTKLKRREHRLTPQTDVADSADSDSGHNFGDRDEDNAHNMQRDFNIDDAMPKDVDAVHGSVTDSLALSRLPDNVGNKAAVNAPDQPSIPTKRTVKLLLSESTATKDNDDPAPRAQKKAKKASTRPQTVPARWNAARAKRANGF